jgi:hypothetical protein
MVWEAVTPVESYLDQATSKARAALKSPATREAYLRRICTRLESETARDLAITLLGELFAADGETETDVAFRENFETMLRGG